MIDLPPERIAEAAGLEILREGPQGRPERAATDSREVSRRRPLLRPAGPRAPTGASSRPARSKTARGASWPCHSTPALRRARVGSGGSYSSQDPLASLQALAREWRWELEPARRRHHRLDRKDLGEGHRQEPASVPHAREPGELQHRDRAAADDSRRATGDGGARARDGDARHGPDRRAAARSRSRRSQSSPTSAQSIWNCSARSMRSSRQRRRSSPAIGPDGQAIVPVDAEALEPHLAEDANVLTFGPGGDVTALETKHVKDGPRRSGWARRQASSGSSCRSPSATTFRTRWPRSRSAWRSTRTSPRWHVGRRT